MKKLFYIFSFFFCQLLFGQNYPQIYPLSGGFTFKDQKLDEYNQTFTANSGLCGFNFSEYYKYYSFKAGFDMDFSFDLKANSTDFRFLVWKLNRGEEPESIFNGGATIRANRSVDDDNFKIKGIKTGEIEECYFYNSVSGYANSFNGSNKLKNGETIVIAVYGISEAEPFDIKVNVAREETIDSFNNLCRGESYTYNQIIDEVKNSSGYTDITLYKNNTFSDSDKINPGEIFNSDTTLYAQVKDDSGSLQVIYTIPLSFKPDHQFNFRSTIQSYYSCTNEFVIPSNQELLSRLFDNVLSTYSISSISINGINYNSGDRAPITQSTEIKIKVLYNGECPKLSDEISISLIKDLPSLERISPKSTCEDNYIIDFDDIFALISKDKNQFDLIVKYNGNQIANGTSLPITDQLNLKISIKSKSGGRCESDEIDFIINKSIPLPIKDALINECLENIDENLIQQKIDEIRNGSDADLKFYYNNQLIQLNEIKTIIETNLNGVIIVESLQGCRITKELKFDIKPGFQWTNPISSISKNCLTANESGTFTKEEIENHLKRELGNPNLIFDEISKQIVNPNTSASIQFRVKEENGCWSNYFTIDLKVSNKPYFNDKIDDVKHCEGSSLIFDATYLKRNFGDNITNYKLKIDGRDLDWNSPYTETLNFGSLNFKKFQINVEDRNSGCSIEVTLTIYKKDERIILLPSQSEIFKKSITFCSGDNEAAIEQLNNAIREFQALNYDTKKTAAEILAEYRNGNQNINIELTNPNFCQTEIAELTFIENVTPSIDDLPNIKETCNNGTSELDLTLIPNYSDYNFILRNAQNQIVYDVNNVYQLVSGNYSLEVSYLNASCSTIYPLEVKAAPTPIIEKIIISNKEIIVQAKGEGTLKYSFDGDDFNLINKRTLKEDQLNKPITISVKLNDCGITEIKNIYVLKIPEVYTPNGDIYNNYWAEGLADSSNEYYIQIFDRYGHIIYENQGVGVLKWDGTKNGKQIPTDTYWYLIKPLKADTMLQVQYSGSILVKHKK